jgi:cytochrome d ubiquinol oxidase subunit II
VAFEFRYKARQSRWVWDLSFVGGSAVATFVQGLTLGALVQGLPITDGHYSGGTFGWFTPFACLCGIGLCIGYGLLGAGWLVAKSEGRLREAAYRLLAPLTAAAMVFLALATAFSISLHFHLMDRWVERPYLAAFPVVGAVAAVRLIIGIRARHDREPFLMTVLIFGSAFGTLALSFWPYMVPFAITVTEAAAPPESLQFMFWGAGVFVLPLTLAYTAAVYRVFRGKIVEVEYGD